MNRLKGYRVVVAGLRPAGFALLALMLSACEVLQDSGDPVGRDHAPSAKREAVEVLPDPINRNVFFLEEPGQSVIGEPQLITARYEDTFSDIAREYGLGYDELVEANPGIDPWLPGEGTRILLPTQYVLPDAPRTGIVLNIAAKRLFYYPHVEEGQRTMVLTYPVGIGRVGWNTPEGLARVVSKTENPTWTPPASVRREHAQQGDPLPAVVPPGPDNPLGSYALRLSLTSYLIHGTNKPYGVGMRVSHGCVRLYPENIAVLYALVEVGEPVNIINEPYLVGWRGGEVYLEAHPPLEEEQDIAAERLSLVLDIEQSKTGFFAEEYQREYAAALAMAGLGVPVRVLQGGPQEVYARAQRVRNTVELAPPDSAGEGDSGAAAAAGDLVEDLVEDPVEDFVEDPANASSAAEEPVQGT